MIRKIDDNTFPKSLNVVEYILLFFKVGSNNITWNLMKDPELQSKKNN